MKKGAVGRLNRRQFEVQAREKGRAYHGRLFSLTSKMPKDGSIKPSFACIVSKKVEKTAVGRNTIKRRAREVMADILAGKKPMVVVARAKQAASGASFTAIERELRDLCLEAGIV